MTQAAFDKIHAGLQEALATLQTLSVLPPPPSSDHWTMTFNDPDRGEYTRYWIGEKEVIETDYWGRKS